jgi:hypothetical protein
VEALPLPLPSTPFPFQSKTKYKSILGSTLVLALAHDEIRNMHLNQKKRYAKIKGIKCAMCAIFQSRFLESSTFSSLLSLQNLFSSRGLVKISASWLRVLTWSIAISPLCW